MASPDPRARNFVARCHEIPAAKSNFRTLSDLARAFGAQPESPGPIQCLRGFFLHALLAQTRDPGETKPRVSHRAAPNTPSGNPRLLWSITPLSSDVGTADAA